MRVIFLDVDGVLNCKPEIDMYRRCMDNPNNHDTSYYFYDQYMKNLSKIYHKYPNTVIVLISTWSDILDTTPLGLQLKEKLAKYDMKIFDTVPKQNKFGMKIESRPEAILEWIRIHGPVYQWVAIEDDTPVETYEKVKKGLSDHLCKTKFGFGEDDLINECGLNTYKMHEALEIIAGIF